MTNATKAQIIAVVNALLGLAVAFDVALTQAQLGAVDVTVNAVLSLLVALTFKNSPRRTPAPPVEVPKP